MEDYSIFSAMQTGEPLARYEKTILGKVSVIALDPFSDKPVGVILEGQAGEEKSFIDIWSDKALSFFQKINKPHINAGRLIRTATAERIEKASPNQLSDEEIDDILNSPFLTLKSKLDGFTDVAPALRILNRARDLDKSEKIIKHIEKRLAELELLRYEM